MQKKLQLKVVYYRSQLATTVYRYTRVDGVFMAIDNIQGDGKSPWYCRCIQFIQTYEYKI